MGPSPHHPCEAPTHLPTTSDGPASRGLGMASQLSLPADGGWGLGLHEEVGGQGTGFHMGQEAYLLTDKQITPNGDSVFPDSCTLPSPTQINASLCLSSPSSPRLCM